MNCNLLVQMNNLKSLYIEREREIAEGKQEESQVQDYKRKKFFKRERRLLTKNEQPKCCN